MNPEIQRHLHRIEGHAKVVLRIPANEPNIGLIQCGIHDALLEIRDCLKAIAEEKCAQKVMTTRKLFEKWISAPPFKRKVTRFPPMEGISSRPGHYRDPEVQLAWLAWEKAVEMECDDNRES